ncbi:MAG: phosphodiester glycosidase family protein, partial [Bacteroidaceae bacterium]
LENMNVGDKLTLKLALALKGTPQVFPDFTSLVGSNIQFLKEGQACDFTSTAGSPTGLAPRTCVGYSKDKQTLYICMVDGYPTSEYRLPDYPSDSKGTTVADLANIMKDAGAYTAMNFDGGGSSYMYLKPKKGPANKPSENGANGGRAVRNALTACSIAPEDSKAVSLKLSTDAIYLEPGQTLKLIASTYNQYGTVIDYNLNTGVTYRSTGSIGTIVNGTLTAASAPQSGKIEATYNGMKASTSIYVGIPIPTEIKTADVENPVYVTFSNGTISVSLPAEEIEMLTIYAITGQSSCKVKGTNRIEVGHLQSGIYLCEILKANGTKQVVKLALTK